MPSGNSRLIDGNNGIYRNITPVSFRDAQQALTQVCKLRAKQFNCKQDD
ncbi:hypothetical protein [Chitinophaga nivalis]|uniref:Uncharacterized protein n=1 Tax=Chitinophaga nivalis TaxID=2991709 RepID=A0ABT3IGS1_9BACT|nr:hypothetical protein [Chitinophaga nivalis]MCW3467170.1 hypothetical protein [Chitinophaga nivalis]MCW3483138.1 hypothetical protein [Chitinophaga nivalis]